MGTQTLYKRLRAGGMTEAGALAMLGNAQCESGLISIRLQGDFQSGYPASQLYTGAVDRGEMGREIFAMDQKGYGLFQWTLSTRKRQLYDYAKAKGVSIGNEEMQADFAMKELREQFAGLWSYLRSTSDLYTATSRVCKEFERPAVNNVDARYNAALRLKAELEAQKTNSERSASGSAGEKEERAVEGAGPYWPPRMLCKGMSGADVTVLQALLTARGYDTTGISADFDGATEAAVRRFQDDQLLAVDGIAGPKTWAALIKI